MLFADDIVRCNTRRYHVEMKLEKWRRAMKELGSNIIRRKNEYLGCNEHNYADVHVQ